MKLVLIIGFTLFVISILVLLYLFFGPKKERKNDKQIEISYSISAGIPFKWEYEIENKKILKFVRCYFLKNNNNGAISGAKVYTNYVFEGLKTGETVIKFKLINVTDNHVSKEDRYIAKVDKNKKITIIEEI